MAVIQTPHGRIIGLILPKEEKPEPVAEQPKPETEPVKRGRPPKNK